MRRIRGDVHESKEANRSTEEITKGLKKCLINISQ